MSQTITRDELTTKRNWNSDKIDSFLNAKKCNSGTRYGQYEYMLAEVVVVENRLTKMGVEWRVEG